MLRTTDAPIIAHHPDLNPVGSKYSCSAGIIPEQTSQTLPAFNAIGRAGSVSRLGEQRDISLSMRTLGMKRFYCEIWLKQADRLNVAHHCLESVQVAPLSR
jgi:hypothetical protein